MSLERVLRDGEKALDAKQYDTAIENFSAHIISNPESFQAFLKRSIAYQRSKQNEKARQDLAEALKIAEKRGRRSDMGLVYFRLGLVAYSAKEYSEALCSLKQAKTFDCQEPTLATWITKAEHDAKKITSSSTSVAATAATASTSPTSLDPPDDSKLNNNEEKPSTHIDTINKYAPLKTKIRDDWYQSATEVIITIYAKNVNKEKFSVEFGPHLVSISFPSEDNSEYNYHLEPLFGEIDELGSSFRVFGTKIEVYLAKKEPGVKWPTLELLGTDTVIRNVPIAVQSTSASQYPSSLKKAVNWATFNLPDDEEQEKSENDFFAKLYKDTDDDTRRAMMKSYVESNGTVLTTNWEEAKEKTYETSPPEGMEAKSWQK